MSQPEGTSPVLAHATASRPLVSAQHFNAKPMYKVRKPSLTQALAEGHFHSGPLLSRQEDPLGQHMATTWENQNI